MNKLLSLMCLTCCILFSCKKDEPCDVLVNGVYQFPEVPENHNMTIKEVNEFLDLPEGICGCISTPGLIETCLNYPHLALIMAGASPQSGYEELVKVQFRGLRELEARANRGTCLLDKFLAIDPLGYDPAWESLEKGRFFFDISFLEIIFSQNVNLKPLTRGEQIALIEKAIDVYNKMKGDDNYCLFGLECTTALMGRLMYLNKFEPMVNQYNTNKQVFELLDFYGPTSIETVELVCNLAKAYLYELKSNQL